MQVGDLITHNPTGAVGTIIADLGHAVEVYWCVDGEEDGDWCEVIAKIYIEVINESR